MELKELKALFLMTKKGVLRAEDGMRKLRIMEKSQGIWTMECQLLIDSKYLIVYDKKNGQEVEIFPMELVCDPTSVVSDDKKDIYNNILLFTVLEDQRKALPATSTTPTEMHIFQCLQTHSAEIVDEIYKVKESKAMAAAMNGRIESPPPQSHHSSSSQHQQYMSNGNRQMQQQLPDQMAINNG